MAVALPRNALIDPGVFGMVIGCGKVRRRGASLGENNGLESADEVALACMTGMDALQQLDEIVNLVMRRALQ
jgi:hypothetical protein